MIKREKLRKQTNTEKNLNCKLLINRKDSNTKT